MSLTHIDSDRIVELSGDTTERSKLEARHLSECAECRLELQMTQAARRLGVAQMTGFDPQRVADGVRHRLATTPVTGPTPGSRRVGYWLAGLAAAAAVVFAVGIGTRNSPAGGVVPVQLAALSTLHELDGLGAPELEEVLRSIPPASEALGHVEIAPLNELNASDLELVLRSMEER